MSSAAPTQQTVEDFVQERAARFRALLEASQPSDELVQLLAQYDPGRVVATVVTVLLPIARYGGLPGLVDEIMERVAPEDPAATRDKVARYLQCFVDALSPEEDAA